MCKILAKLEKHDMLQKTQRSAPLKWPWLQGQIILEKCWQHALLNILKMHLQTKFEWNPTGYQLSNKMTQSKFRKVPNIFKISGTYRITMPNMKMTQCTVIELIVGYSRTDRRTRTILLRVTKYNTSRHNTVKPLYFAAVKFLCRLILWIQGISNSTVLWIKYFFLNRYQIQRHTIIFMLPRIKFTSI